ncbi:putative zinc finger and SCAN domain-containing protein 5D [Anopheles ziemanni]|uniref:putative zinc finger and SCAN domain-containing protein 5D n=1 Tax=Anopheles ziemanni TaxID=345580 RepID=UPI00265F44ED|nr:putative zinc finger and SCAN domain-containing protein 5D [Anopheles ziemanni]
MADLNVLAVPSIKEETDISRPEADRHESFADVNHPQAINASLPNYREQFCRTCLKHCPDDSSIPVASQIQNMVVLDMLVHLTGFETDDSDEFPSVICLECKNNLVQAFNIRQEFIVKAEFLVQLVAEEKLADYFHTIEDKAQKSMKPRTSKRFIFTDINQAYRNLSIEPLFPINNPASRCSPGILDENNGETIKHELEQHESDISDINDHSCYAKVVDGNEDPATNSDLEQQTGPDERTVKIEDTCTRSNTPDIQSDENLEQSDAWNEFMVNYEKEKSMKRKLNFACEICQKSFKLPQYLQAHMQTHSSERKFSCEICGNCYKTKGELKKHIQRKHGDENNDSRNEDGIIIKVEFCEEVPTSNA